MWQSSRKCKLPKQKWDTGSCIKNKEMYFIICFNENRKRTCQHLRPFLCASCFYNNHQELY